ncbi:hypothetical protein GCM10008959_01020 [Deinococcus seoulensis]|uniref:Uncharacterized protein n=1 Tax=Deinococcus seoulensis TaxID=1837379 RepID=A0ABQ2RKC4_9DEIO|nr:hypothetical protein GCM10008959_01020 [Deinococcus seoulensis]
MGTFNTASQPFYSAVAVPEGPGHSTDEQRSGTEPADGGDARKVSQCSKNAVRAQTYMRIKSTVETARLRCQNPVAVLTGLMR